MPLCTIIVPYIAIKCKANKPYFSKTVKYTLFALTFNEFYNIINWVKEMKFCSKHSKNICPVCGETEFSGIGDICPVCGWEHDKVQERDPDFSGGANKLSLNQAKAKYNSKEKKYE